MSFLYPQFLWAFLILAVPVIIHLFNFKRQRIVLFSDISLLKELNESRKSGVRLRDLILLILRLLAFSAIILAFAQPYFSSGKNQAAAGLNYVSVYVDNSLSTQSIGTNGSLLDEALTEISVWADQFSEQDKFHLITNDIKTHQQRFVSKREFLDFLAEVDASPVTRSLSKIILAQKEILTNSKGKTKAVLVSDFQKNTSDFNQAEWDKNTSYQLLHLQSLHKNNIYIDSVGFDNPVFKTGRSLELKFRIVNSSHEDIENIQVELQINNVNKGFLNISIPSQSYNIGTFTFTVKDNGWQQGALKISDKEVFFDDNFHFSFHAETSLKVLEITNDESNNRLNKLYTLDNYYDFNQVHFEKIKQEMLNENHFIILHGLQNISSGLASELNDFTHGGGTLLIIPGNNIDLAGYNAFLNNLNAPSLSQPIQKGRLKEIVYEDPFFRDIFESEDTKISLPEIRKHYPINTSSVSMVRSLYKMSDGKTFISSNNHGKGRIYLQAVGLEDEFGDWHKTALFTTTLLRMAETAGERGDLYHFFGKDIILPIKLRDSDVKEAVYLHDAEGKHIKLPVLIKNKQKEVHINGNEVMDFLKKDGIYLITESQESSKPLMALAINYDRRESDMTSYSPEDINKIISENDWENINVFSNNETQRFADNTLRKASEIWRFLLILAVIFFLGEMLINKFWKV